MQLLSQSLSQSPDSRSPARVLPVHIARESRPLCRAGTRGVLGIAGLGILEPSMVPLGQRQRRARLLGLLLAPGLPLTPLLADRKVPRRGDPAEGAG
jgi:hypothetical protein